MEKSKFFTISNVLTLVRLVVSPLMLPVLLVYLLPFNSLLINGALAFLFVLFSLTDFFDGYFARKYRQETVLGKVLDPIADKFLVYSVLISLLAVNKIFFYWVIILIGRELFVMGLRTIALEHNITLPVLYFAKMKTAAQMILITYLIINPYQGLGFKAFSWNACEYVLLALTIGLSLFSAYQYYTLYMEQFKSKKPEEDKSVYERLEI